MQGLLAAQSHLQTHASFTAPRTFTISSEAQTTANDPTVITWFTTITRTAIKMYENTINVFMKSKNDKNKITKTFSKIKKKMEKYLNINQN